MSVDDSTGAVAMFGVGIYFWPLLGAVITARLFFVGDYLRVPFTAQHWVFTLPLSVLASMSVRWAGGRTTTIGKGWPGQSSPSARS